MKEFLESVVSPETKNLEKEIFQKKEIRKHLDFHDVEKEVFEPCPREEPSYDAISDMEDEELEEDGL